MTDETDSRRRALAFNAVGSAVNAAGHWLPLSARRAVADAVLEAVGDPAERCGDQLPRIDSDAFTECVLRPGHQGSHADHQDCRWTRTAATRDTCLDAPQLTADIGYPVRCPHCKTSVPPTHWTKHLQRHHPDVDAWHAADACPGFKPSGLCMLCGDSRSWHRGDQPATGYCPHCGRGDAGPTADEYEQARRQAIRIQALLDEQRDRIRKLHRAAHYGGRIICAECSAYDGHSSTDSPPVDHPCPTIAALQPPTA